VLHLICGIIGGDGLCHISQLHEQGSASTDLNISWSIACAKLTRACMQLDVEDFWSAFPFGFRAFILHLIVLAVSITP